MNISEKAWKSYITQLAKINNLAAEAVKRYVEENGIADVYELTAVAFGAATKYGEAAAALAADMYDAIAEASKTNLPPAEVAETASYGEVAKTVQGVLKTSENADELGGAVSRLAKRAGADTTLRNALRDGAEFAWIPSGDSCAFCITLASRGWQRASKDAIKDGHAEHIHANCNCTYAIRFDKNTNVAGYDPDKYLEMYRNAPLDEWNTPNGEPPKGDEGAEKNTPKNRINAMRREFYAENKKEINAQKREAYTERNEFISVFEKYKDTATPGTGKLDIPKEREIKNREEINCRLIYQQFGGDISMPPETWQEGVKNPDYIWRRKYWEEKEPRANTKNAISKNVREAIHQIANNPGGVILDVGESTMPLEEIKDTALKRFKQSAPFDCDLILIRNGKIEDIWHYNKIKR